MFATVYFPYLLAAVLCVIIGLWIRRKQKLRRSGNLLIVLGALVFIGFLSVAIWIVRRTPDASEQERARAVSRYINDTFNLRGGDRAYFRAHLKSTEINVYGVMDAETQKRIICFVHEKPEAKQGTPIIITFLTSRDQENSKSPSVLKTVTVQDEKCN